MTQYKFGWIISSNISHTWKRLISFYHKKSDTVLCSHQSNGISTKMMKCACTVCTERIQCDCINSFVMSIPGRIPGVMHVCFTSNVYYCFQFSYVSFSLPLFFSFALERTVLAPQYDFFVFLFVWFFYWCIIRICLSIVWFLFTIFTVPSFIRLCTQAKCHQETRLLWQEKKTTQRCLRMCYHLLQHTQFRNKWTFLLLLKTRTNFRILFNCQ